VRTIQRIDAWTSYGALGPLLVLLGGVAAWAGLRFLGTDTTYLGRMLIVSAAVGGGILMATGILFVARPRTQYWLAIVILGVMAFTQIVLSISKYGLVVTGWLMAGLWVVIAVVVSLYAYHCHRPVYSDSVPD